MGWLPGEARETVGAHLRVPKSEVYGVASSFPDFLLAEPAEHVRRACIGPACRMAGAPAVGATEVDCLFVCGVAPASQVDGRLIGHGGRPIDEFRGKGGPEIPVQEGPGSRAGSDTGHAG